MDGCRNIIRHGLEDQAVILGKGIDLVRLDIQNTDYLLVVDQTAHKARNGYSQAEEAMGDSVYPSLHHSPESSFLHAPPRE